jgi:alkyl sulfatase BDS1-like metallo-beta-lactamase superfamily hydrolase
VPEGTPDPDVTFDESLTLTVGDDRFVIQHDRGETDDHGWTRWEGHDTLFVGDFLIWNFPNCGNPQKVLRYPAEWAAALRKMAATRPELVGPAHGLPVMTSGRVDRVLLSTADALDGLVTGVIELLNQDASLDDAIHTVKVPEAVLALPWMKPFYDEPEFVVRNIWRTYGGWWDRNPAHLHPAPEASVAAEVVALAGGVEPVIARASSLMTSGDLRTAGELLEFAVKVDPKNVAAHEVRAMLYDRRRKEATSLMAKGIYQATALESSEVTGAYPEGSTPIRSQVL